MNKLILLILVVCLSMIGCQEQSQKTPAASATPPASSPAAEPAAPQTALQPSDQTAQPEPAPSAGSEPASPLQTGLAHHNFIFKSFDGREVPSTNPDGSRREPPHLSFSQWPHANGKICNGFRGPVELKGNTLTMKNAASTMMLCVDPIINELESTFYQMMSVGGGAELNQRVLTLTGGGHTLVLELSDYVN
jgi:heat shock protein HslJ